MFIVWISLTNDVSWMNTVLRQKEKLVSVPLHNPGRQSLIEIWNFSGCQSQFPTGPHRFNSPAQCFGQKAGLMCGKSSALLWCQDESKRGLYIKWSEILKLAPKVKSNSILKGYTCSLKLHINCFLMCKHKDWQLARWIIYLFL